MKIVTIVGARPQFVKAAAVSRSIAKFSQVEEVIVHTGQHFDANMSDVFFDEMQIPKPKYNLDIHSVGHGAMTGRMLEGIEQILLNEKPDLLLVYGDTNSTIAGALAAKKLHIKVGHVEAGLRSFNMLMPEEVNRILTDRISDFLFCPTDTAVSNLTKEGYQNIDTQVIRTGDVMQDAAIFYSAYSKEKSNLPSSIPASNFVLCTIHRAENTDDYERMKSLVDALNNIHSEKMPVVVPLHPRTKKKLADHNLVLNVAVIDPVGYFDMIELLKKCSLVMTDSGGLQKEAFFFKKNCITLRDQTEWVELVQNGFNVLAGADYTEIITQFETMSIKDNDFSIDLYGKGKAADAIIQHIINKC